MFQHESVAFVRQSPLTQSILLSLTDFLLSCEEPFAAMLEQDVDITLKAGDLRWFSRLRLADDERCMKARR